MNLLREQERQYPRRPSTSSYDPASRRDTEEVSYPVSIDARARFRDQQQPPPQQHVYYPPRTAAPATGRGPSRPILSVYPPTGAYPSSRPTTAPAAAASPRRPMPDSYGPARHPAYVDRSYGRGTYDEEMPPPRGFGTPSTSRNPAGNGLEGSSPYTGDGPRQHNYVHTSSSIHAPSTYRPAVYDSGQTLPRVRPTSSSGPRITLPSLSEMIRRPDLDENGMPNANTSALRTLLNPEARPGDLGRLPSFQAQSCDREALTFSASHARGASPARSDEQDHLADEDRRYYEIRARQLQARRSSLPEDPRTL